MNTEEIYTYILTMFEGKSFENLILNKTNTQYKESFEKEYRDKLIEALNTDEYSKVMSKLAKSFMTNLAKGAQTNRFTKKECDDILAIYHKLIEDIGNTELPYEKIAAEHFARVRNYITAFMDENKQVEEDTTSSYSPEFVLKVLDVNIEGLQGGKTLDIGCGKKAELVNYLVSKGIDAHGMDMECEDSDILEQEDWLCADFEPNTYDLITANLTFTKHFNEANMEEANDQECFEYAQSYMKILNALKVGATFHYVPAVTFIEEILPEDKFEVKNSFVNESVMRTVVKRLK